MGPKQKAVRDQILRTAADLFRERGYRASTLDDIAARLGMSKASLYTYFRGKEEMLAAISRETIEGFTRELGLVLRSDLSPEDKLRRIVRDHVRFVIANRSFLTVFFSEEANLPPRFVRAIAAPEGPLRQGCGVRDRRRHPPRGVPGRAAPAGRVRPARDAQLALQVVQPARAAGAPRRSPRPSSSSSKAASCGGPRAEWW